MKGRQIAENVLLMHDIVKGYNRKGGKPIAVLKIDIMKAYDSFRWEFLFEEPDELSKEIHRLGV